MSANATYNVLARFKGSRQGDPLSFVCLYHRTERNDVSVEDILQKAFGGRKTSRTLICADCNNTLGSSIDKKFAESLEWITTLLDPVGRRRAPATLKNVVDQDGSTWHIAAGGKPSVPYKSTGPASWIADVSTLETAKRNAEAKAKAMGISDPVIEIRHEQTKAAPFQFQLKVENENVFRSACKSALELLALIGFDDADRRSDLLLDARSFVMTGSPSYTNVGWLENSILQDAFDGFDHYILLVQSEENSVYWEFVLYGGVIAVSGRFSAVRKRIGAYIYRMCPRTGDVFDGSIDLTVPSRLVTWSTVTTSALRERTTRTLEKISLSVMTNSIVDELPEDFDTLDAVKKNEHLTQLKRKLLETLVNSISAMTGQEPLEVMSLMCQQIASRWESPPNNEIK